MLKRSAMILALALALLPMMQFVHYRGSRLVGFKYSRSVNNLATECPDTVAALDGRKITLADGRAFDVEDVSASAIAEESCLQNWRPTLGIRDPAREFCG